MTSGSVAVCDCTQSVVQYADKKEDWYNREAELILFTTVHEFVHITSDSVAVCVDIICRMLIGRKIGIVKAYSG